MNRPKTLIIIPNLGKGGAQRVFHQHLDFLSQQTEVIGCVFNWDDAFESDRKSNIVSLDVPAGRSLFGKIVYFWKRCVALRRIKKQHEIEVSISHLEGADYVNILSRVNERTVCWIHGTKKFDHNIEGLLGWIRHRILIPTFYRRTDLITVSEGIRTELITAYGVKQRRVRYIPNGFDLENIRWKSQQALDERASILTRSNPMITISSHCRLARQKNIDAMLEVFAKVKNVIPSRLVILGDGELRMQLLSHAEELGLRTFAFWRQQDVTQAYDVYFFGHFDNPYPVLVKSDLYVMTSSWEGFPLALCEAMACGIPVMTTDCFTGPREVIAPEIAHPQPVQQPVITDFGILMPLAASKSGVQCWAESIVNFVNDESLSGNLASNASRRVEAFDIQRIQKQWLDELHS